MKFHSPTDQPIHVALTTGATVNVTPEGVDIEDAAMRREAIARGCVPAALLGDAGTVRPTEPVFSRKDAIANALKEMLDGSNPDDFKKDGTPDMRQVSRRVGFAVQRDELEAAWAEASKTE